MLLSRFDLVFYQSTAISLDILKVTEKGLCDFRQSQVEDEFHFVRMCPLYKRLRTKYIDPDMRKKNTFIRLFCCISRRKMLEACCICFSCFQIKTAVPRTRVKCINHSQDKTVMLRLLWHHLYCIFLAKH